MQVAKKFLSILKPGKQKSTEQANNKSKQYNILKT